MAASLLICAIFLREEGAQSAKIHMPLCAEYGLQSFFSRQVYAGGQICSRKGGKL
jgi:hypothetical protein